MFMKVVKFGCLIGIFLDYANLICRSTDIPSVSEGPFDFEITRVNCRPCLYHLYNLGST